MLGQVFSVLCLLLSLGICRNIGIKLGNVNKPGSSMRLVIELGIWFKSTRMFTLRRSQSLFVLQQFGGLLLQLSVTRLILMQLSWKVQIE